MFNGFIMSLEFVSGVVGRKAPFQLDDFLVTRFHLGGDFPAQDVPIGDTAVAALPAQDGQLQFGYVEPTGLLRRAMRFETALETAGDLRLESLIEGPGEPFHSGRRSGPA